MYGEDDSTEKSDDEPSNYAEEVPQKRQRKLLSLQSIEVLCVCICSSMHAQALSDTA
jgi:hypothetical protein